MERELRDDDLDLGISSVTFFFSSEDEDGVQ